MKLVIVVEVDGVDPVAVEPEDVAEVVCAGPDLFGYYAHPNRPGDGFQARLVRAGWLDVAGLATVELVEDEEEQ